MDTNIELINKIIQLQAEVLKEEASIKEKYFHIFFSNEVPLNLLDNKLTITSTGDYYLKTKIKEMEEILTMYRISNKRLATEIITDLQEYIDTTKDSSLLNGYPLQFLKFLKTIKKKDLFN